MAKRSKEGPNFEDEEIVAMVWDVFKRGYTLRRTAKMVAAEYGIAMNANDVEAALHTAAKREYLRLRFYTPKKNPYTAKILHHHQYLKSVNVIDTALTADLAQETARILVGFIKTCAEKNPEEVRIGVSGGRTVRKVIENMAMLLEDDPEGLPTHLTFVALVSGFDLAGVDPTAFFLYLDRPSLKKRCRCLLLRAPSIIEPSQWRAFLDLPNIWPARREVLKLDLILTSAAEFADPHGLLRQCYTTYELPSMIETLEAEGCVGDIIWMPISRDGAMSCDKHKYAAMTLLTLEEIRDGILNPDRNLRVLLAVGPCTADTTCHRLKAHVLRTLLKLGRSQQTQFITDVVVDSRTARQICKDLDEEPPAQPTIAS